MTTVKPVICSCLLASVLLIASCESSRRARSMKVQYKTTYINQFKLLYFRQLLAKSYNHSNAVQEMISTDHSAFTEPILTDEDFTLIDSFTTIDNQYLVADSAEGHRRAEGSKGKRPLGYIMEKLNSKWLDSLAKQRLKINGAPDSWIR